MPNGTNSSSCLTTSKPLPFFYNGLVDIQIDNKIMKQVAIHTYSYLGVRLHVGTLILV